MTLNIIRPESIPSRPYPDDLYNFPITVIPALQYGLWLKSQPYYWLSDDDTLKARSVLSEVGAALLMPLGRDILNILQATYNLHSSAYFNRTRTVEGEGTAAIPFVYTPPIPQTVSKQVELDDPDTTGGGIVVHTQLSAVWAKDIDDLLGSALFGFDSYDTNVNTFSQLEDIKTKLDTLATGDTGDKLDTIISDLELLALLLGV